MHRPQNLTGTLVQEADWCFDLRQGVSVGKLYGSWSGWKAKVIVDMADCPEVCSCRRGQGGYLCRYFDRILQGGEKGRMGFMHAELVGARTEVVNVEC